MYNVKGKLVLTDAPSTTKEYRQLLHSSVELSTILRVKRLLIGLVTKARLSCVAAEVCKNKNKNNNNNNNNNFNLHLFYKIKLICIQSAIMYFFIASYIVVI